MQRYESAGREVVPVDEEARAEAARRQLSLTKPPGALGMLEEVGNQLSAIAGRCPPPVPVTPWVVVFASDHGVLAEGVSPWPQEVTGQMVRNFARGGAAINVIARTVGASVKVVDIGMATDLPGEVDVVKARVRNGTGNIAREQAMSREEASVALDAGVAVAHELTGGGADLLVTGDMGIGNTTPSAAVIAVLTGSDVAEVTGRGTGIDDDTFSRKLEVVRKALSRATSAGMVRSDGLSVLGQLGGLEIAGIAGLVIGAASRRVPVLIDGVIAAAGALVAASICPAAGGYCIAGHLSVEPGARAALRSLGLRPLLDLSMRLGEGTGAALAVPIVGAAARLLCEMATFESAGVAEV